MTVELRALERDDLRFVHRLNNDSSVMTYWFDEPFESLAELTDIYDRHIHDNRERRFVVETGGADRVQVGIVELVEIEPVHLTAEFQIIVAPDHQGKGYASTATDLALRYAFATLNLHKVYLIVDVENAGRSTSTRRTGSPWRGRCGRSSSPPVATATPSAWASCSATTWRRPPDRRRRPCGAAGTVRPSVPGGPVVRHTCDLSDRLGGEPSNVLPTVVEDAADLCSPRRAPSRRLARRCGVSTRGR